MESQAERLAKLEEWQRQAREEFDHIHSCVHSIKESVNKATELVKKWDTRFSLAVAFLAGLIFTSGSGPLSFKSLFEILGHWLAR